MRQFVKIMVLVIAFGLTNDGLSVSECRMVYSDDIYDIFWSHDSRHVVFQKLPENPDEERPLLQWDPDSGDEPSSIQAIESNLSWQQTPAGIAWTSDGSKVAFETTDTVQVYKNEHLVFKTPKTEKGNPYWGVLWTFDSKFLLTLTLSSIQVWVTDKWEPYVELDLDPTEGLALSARENKFSLPARWYNAEGEVLGIEIYDIDKKRVEKRLPLDEPDLLGRRFNSLEFPIWILNDKYILISIDQAPILPHMWNVETQKLVDINIHTRHDWDNFENLLAVVTARDDYPLEIWDMSMIEKIQTYYFDEFIWRVRWSPDGSQFAVVGSFNIHVCDYSKQVR